MVAKQSAEHIQFGSLADSNDWIDLALQEIDPKKEHNTYRVSISYFSGPVESMVKTTDSYIFIRISGDDADNISSLDSFINCLDHTFDGQIKKRLPKDGCEIVIESTYIEDGVTHSPEYGEENSFVVTNSSTPQLYAAVEEVLSDSWKYLC